MLILGCLSRYHQTSSKLNSALAEKQAEAARVEDLQIQSLRLGAQIERIKTDPKAVEALARQNGFVRPGDIVLRIKPDLNSSEGPLAASASSQHDDASASSQQGQQDHERGLSPGTALRTGAPNTAAARTGAPNTAPASASLTSPGTAAVARRVLP
jgi:hypothetical protein